MGRKPCCEKVGLKRGPWTIEEDHKLMTFILNNGIHCWRLVPKLAGLSRCGKSCRLRWINYLRPDLKRGGFTELEEEQIIELHSRLGNRWSKIASYFPGRTDNEIKNHWNTRIKKKMKLLGLDPVTHKPVDLAEKITDTDHEKSELIEPAASDSYNVFEDRLEDKLSHDMPSVRESEASQGCHEKQEARSDQDTYDDLLDSYEELCRDLDLEMFLASQQINSSSSSSSSSSLLRVPPFSLDEYSDKGNLSSSDQPTSIQEKVWVDDSLDPLATCWDLFGSFEDNIFYFRKF